MPLGIIGTSRKVVKTLPLPFFHLPWHRISITIHGSLSDITSFGYLDPFKNAMLEFVASDMPLAYQNAEDKATTGSRRG